MTLLSLFGMSAQQDVGDGRRRFCFLTSGLNCDASPSECATSYLREEQDLGKVSVTKLN
jgi:hypothetical protein